MKKLFDDMIKGLESQGYKVKGGGNLYCILSKDDREVKVFAKQGKLPSITNTFFRPEHIVVRYSV